MSAAYSKLMRGAASYLIMLLLLCCADAATAGGSTESSGPKVVRSGGTEWQVFCRLNACAANAGELWVVCREGNLYLIGFRDFEVQHWHNRSVQPLPIAEPLDDFQIATLMARGELILTNEEAVHFNRDAPISTRGFEKVLHLMAATVSCLPEEGQMTYRALVDGQSGGNQNQQVPFTKPQVEIAIRAHEANTD